MLKYNVVYTQQSKNTLIINILKILEKHSDKNHRLTQQDIIDLLKSEYNMDVERKSIARNIDNLIESDFEIEYDEIKRGTGKDANFVRTNFYIEREFDDSELRFLIDGILFSKLMQYNQKKDLIKKLEGLSSKYFKKGLGKVDTVRKGNSDNDDLFLNIETIAEAIEKKKMISFNYCGRQIDKKLHIRKDKEGNARTYDVSPYQMVAVNSRYYLVCVGREFDAVSNWRVDRMKNIKILDEPLKVIGNGIEYNIPKHVMEHIYMMSGEDDLVTFKFKKSIINDVIDWFDEDILLKDLDDEWIEAKVKVNLRAMRFWAMQYGDFVVVESPEKLVDEIKDTLKEMKERYKG